MKALKTILLCLGLFLPLALRLLADDVVQTKDGQVYKGKILKEKDHFVIMQVKILQRDISQIDREKDRDKNKLQALDPGPGQAVVTTKQGQVHLGTVLEENDRFIKLAKDIGQVTIWKSVIAGIKRGPPATTPPLPERLDTPKPVLASASEVRKPEKVDQKKTAKTNVYFYIPKKLKGKKVLAVYENFYKRARERVFPDYQRFCSDCQVGDETACYLLGKYFLDVASAKKLKKKYKVEYIKYGLYLMEKSCAGGIGVACNYLGNLIEENRANPLYGDLIRAYVFYEKGCKAQYPSGAACGIIAFAYSYNDPEFLKSTGLSYRPLLWQQYLDRGCRYATEVTANEGQRCCEQLANAFENGSREVSKSPAKAKYYQQAAQESEKRFQGLIDKHKNKYRTITIASQPLTPEKRKEKIKEKVDHIVASTGSSPEPKPVITGNLTDDLGNLRAPDPFLTFTELSNLATYGCTECDACKKSREFRYYERKTKGRGRNAHYCASIVLACCYLKKGLYKEMDSSFELTEDQLLQLVRENRAKAQEIGPCIFTCDYQQ